MFDSKVPSDFMEPRALHRRNDNDWRIEQNRGSNEEATQRSIAISLKRLADIAEAWARGSFNYDPAQPLSENHNAKR